MDDLNKKYSVTLADGTVLENLTLNGNNYISETEVNREVFEGSNLYSVTISDGETEEIHFNMELVRFVVEDGKYWFALRDMPAEKVKNLKLQADLEYLAMMTGVVL